jgi:hypothetical protein
MELWLRAENGALSACEGVRWTEPPLAEKNGSEEVDESGRTSPSCGTALRAGDGPRALDL